MILYIKYYYINDYKLVSYYIKKSINDIYNILINHTYNKKKYMISMSLNICIIYYLLYYISIYTALEVLYNIYDIILMGG